MKLKYYLRGLGIGILVTGLIMGIANKNAISQAKDEVRKVYEQELREQETDEEALSGQTSEESDANGEMTAQQPAESENQEENVFGQELPSIQETADQQTTQQKPSTDESEAEVNSSSAGADNDNETDRTENANMQDNNSASNIMDDASGSDNEGNAGDTDADNDSESDNPTNNGNTDAVTIQVSGGDDSGVVSRKLYNAGLIENAAEYDAFLMQHGYDKKITTGEKKFYQGESWQEIAEKLIKK